MEPINKKATNINNEELDNGNSTGIKTDNALRYNEGKPKWHLVDFESLIPLVRVLEYGAVKYEPFNWKKEMKREDVLDSMMRHMVSLISNKEIDEESKQHEIGHIMANAMFYSFHFNKKSI